ncbi:hypothetical protein ACGFNU_10110 [Spirillospora sp. NPDC048911]|uniref:hypothetical protein n=1 Tax=Spirillospora sp. NPDC048911 TaxID=3364527 RepID=UPI00371CC49C
MAEPLKPGDPERLGAYELVGRLGEGGQGVVFEGRGPEDERVAVKLLRAQLSGDPTARARFVRELEAAERVGWLNVVPRAAMGLSAAAMSATGVALVREAFPGRGFAVPIGIWGAVAGMPAVLGSVVASLLGDGTGQWLGLRLLPTMVGALVAAPLTGLLISKAGVRWPPATAPIMLALGALGAMVMLDAHTPYAAVAVLLLVEGAALGALTVGLAVAIVGDPPGGLTGFAGGLQEMCQWLGVHFAALLLLLGKARDLGGDSSMNIANIDEVHRLPLLVAVLVALLAAVVLVVIRRPDLEPAARSEPLGGPAHPGLPATQPGPQGASPAFYAGAEPPSGD